MSALKYAFSLYGWNTEVFCHPLVSRLLKGINFTVHGSPSPKGLFSFQQICEISALCDLFESSLTYRTAFLLGFYGLFHISNVAPTSHSTFDPTKQLLREDITITFLGTHVRVKRAKNLQNPKRVHIVKLPQVFDPLLCPTYTLKTLLKKRVLAPSDPLLVCDDFSLVTQSNIRKRLATFVRSMGLPLLGYGFHTFPRSGATIAFEANTPLSSIKTHGL